MEAYLSICAAGINWRLGGACGEPNTVSVSATTGPASRTLGWFVDIAETTMRSAHPMSSSVGVYVLSPKIGVQTSSGLTITLTAAQPSNDKRFEGALRALFNPDAEGGCSCCSPSSPRTLPKDSVRWRLKVLDEDGMDERELVE
jgi:hypothetical protein